VTAHLFRDAGRKFKYEEVDEEVDEVPAEIRRPRVNSQDRSLLINTMTDEELTIYLRGMHTGKEQTTLQKIAYRRYEAVLKQERLKAEAASRRPPTPDEPSDPEDTGVPMTEAEIFKSLAKMGFRGTFLCNP